MKGWQKRRKEIREELIGQTGKRALLVEGREDMSLLRILLEEKLKKKDWEYNWALAAAGNKKIVIDILENEPDWFGIVDRDEWTDEIIHEKQRELNNLFILPRFCMEN